MMLTIAGNRHQCVQGDSDVHDADITIIHNPTATVRLGIARRMAPIYEG